VTETQKYTEACMLIIDGMDKISKASKLINPKSEEFFKILELKILMNEPLSRIKTKCDFCDWSFKEDAKENSSNI